MNPKVEHIVYPEHASVAVQNWQTNAFDFLWHHHREVELTWVHSSRGKRYVGDHVDSYGSDELVLLGSNLPHTWAGGALHANSLVEATVVQFMAERVLGDEPVPELESIRQLLVSADRGLRFDPVTIGEVEPLRQKMCASGGAERYLIVLQILEILAKASDTKQLASPQFSASGFKRQGERMQKVMAYLNKHFAEPLSLDELAQVAAMSRSAFCRYFKRVTGSGFIDYLNGLRLSHACSLLRDSDRSVALICYESGFGNLSNFNRQFKRSRKITPREYRKQWR